MNIRLWPPCWPLGLLSGWRDCTDIRMKPLFERFCSGSAFFSVVVSVPGKFPSSDQAGTDIHVIFDQFGNAWDDWLTYGFWVFASVLPVAAVAAGGLARPRWRVSLADKLSIPVMMILGGAAYILLSASIVFVHALSDVPISLTSKLPASLALPAAYLLAFFLWIAWLGSSAFMSRLPWSQGQLRTRCTLSRYIFRPPAA